MITFNQEEKELATKRIAEICGRMDPERFSIEIGEHYLRFTFKDKGAVAKNLFEKLLSKAGEGISLRTLQPGEPWEIHKTKGGKGKESTQTERLAHQKIDILWPNTGRAHQFLHLLAEEERAHKIKATQEQIALAKSYIARHFAVDEDTFTLSPQGLNLVIQPANPEQPLSPNIIEAELSKLIARTGLTVDVVDSGKEHAIKVGGLTRGNMRITCIDHPNSGNLIVLNLAAEEKKHKNPTEASPIIYGRLTPENTLEQPRKIPGLYY